MSVCGFDTSLGIKDSGEVNFSWFKSCVDKRQLTGIIGLNISAEKVLLPKSDRCELAVVGGCLFAIVKVV